MARQKSELVDKYNSLIRDIVNDCVKPMQDVKKGTFLAKAKSRLKYDREDRRHAQPISNPGLN